MRALGVKRAGREKCARNNKEDGLDSEGNGQPGSSPWTDDPSNDSGRKCKQEERDERRERQGQRRLDRQTNGEQRHDERVTRLIRGKRFVIAEGGGEGIGMVIG